LTAWLIAEVEESESEEESEEEEKPPVKPKFGLPQLGGGDEVRLKSNTKCLD
jgi:hypothetical protein